MLKTWRIFISVNEWEFVASVIIKAHSIERVKDSDTSIIVDGIYMEFDEKIGDPELIIDSD